MWLPVLSCRPSEETWRLVQLLEGLHLKWVLAVPWLCPLCGFHYLQISLSTDFLYPLEGIVEPLPHRYWGHSVTCTLLPDGRNYCVINFNRTILSTCNDKPKRTKANKKNLLIQWFRWKFKLSNWNGINSIKGYSGHLLALQADEIIFTDQKGPVGDENQTFLFVVPVVNSGEEKGWTRVILAVFSNCMLQVNQLLLREERNSSQNTTLVHPSPRWQQINNVNKCPSL